MNLLKSSGKVSDFAKHTEICSETADISDSCEKFHHACARIILIHAEMLLLLLLLLSQISCIIFEPT